MDKNYSHYIHKIIYIYNFDQEGIPLVYILCGYSNSRLLFLFLMVNENIRYPKSFLQPTAISLL